MNKNQPSITILYHFFYPDDVVSARLFSDFAEELANRGWNVRVLTSNRYCCYHKKKIELKEEEWKGMKIFRIYRPGWNQARYFPRLANSLWIMAGWVVKLLKIPKTDIVIVGSDPQFSQMLFPVLKFFRRQKFLVYWCYDLYPEALMVESRNRVIKWFAKEMIHFMKLFYKQADLIVVIGQCMRRRFDKYRLNKSKLTLTPWALVEPINKKEPDPLVRHELFGKAKLALLYSGNMGKAHDFLLFLKLARTIYKKDPGIIFCFSCRGNRFADLKASIREEDRNIRLVPFAEESELEKRLNTADIHLLSLRPEWEGVVVPSKFFGSLAVGKPVLYAGPESSAIADWIRRYDLGLIVTEDNFERIAMELLELAENHDKLRNWGENAFNVYQRYFSKKIIMDEWDRTLRDLMGKGR